MSDLHIENASNTLTHITQLLHERYEKGNTEYGKPIDDAVPPTGSWKTEALEEMADLVTYLVKLVKQYESNDIAVNDAYKDCAKIVDEYESLFDEYRAQITHLEDVIMGLRLQATSLARRDLYNETVDLKRRVRDLEVENNNLRLRLKTKP